MDFDEAILNLTQKFTSGNDIRVERSVILRSEFDAIMSKMAEHGLVKPIEGKLINGG